MSANGWLLLTDFAISSARSVVDDLIIIMSPFKGSHSRKTMETIPNIWQRHEMQTLSSLLALCEELTPVTGSFPVTEQVMRGFEVFSVARLHKLFNKQQWVATCRRFAKVAQRFTIPRMSRTDGRDVSVAMHGYGISMTSQSSHVYKHCFSAFLTDKTWSVEAKARLSWGSFCSSSNRCGIEAQDPSRLDSGWWIPRWSCCENPTVLKPP